MFHLIIFSLKILEIHRALRKVQISIIQTAQFLYPNWTIQMVEFTRDRFFTNFPMGTVKWSTLTVLHMKGSCYLASCMGRAILSSRMVLHTGENIRMAWSMAKGSLRSQKVGVGKRLSFWTTLETKQAKMKGAPLKKNTSQI